MKKLAWIINLRLEAMCVKKLAWVIYLGKDASEANLAAAKANLLRRICDSKILLSLFLLNVTISMLVRRVLDQSPNASKLAAAQCESAKLNRTL